MVNAWLWIFGDTFTSTQQNPTHIYDTAGVYAVVLTVNGPGGTDTLARTNYITVSEPPLVAVFTAAPTTGVRPLTVFFADTSTGTVSSWLWDFGDEITGSLQSPTHTYTTAGVYTVSLTILGPAGESNTLVRPSFITVYSVPMTTTIVKSVLPQGQVKWGNTLTYTLVISGLPGTQLAVYDPLADTTFVRFVVQPTGITFADHTLTGAVNISAQPITVAFVVRASSPMLAGSTISITNRACAYTLPGSLADCQWSNAVTNTVFRPYGIFLPLVLRQ